MAMNAEELKMVILEREYINKAMQSAAANKLFSTMESNDDWDSAVGWSLVCC